MRFELLYYSPSKYIAALVSNCSWQFSIEKDNDQLILMIFYLLVSYLFIVLVYNAFPADSHFVPHSHPFVEKENLINQYILMVVVVD